MPNKPIYLADSSVILAGIRPPDLRAGEVAHFEDIQRNARDILQCSAVSSAHVAEVLEVLVRKLGHTPQTAVALIDSLKLTELPLDGEASRFVATVRAADKDKLLSICDLIGLAHAKAAGLVAVTGDVDWLVVWAALPEGWSAQPKAFQVMDRRPKNTKSAKLKNAGEA